MNTTEHPAAIIKRDQQAIRGLTCCCCGEPTRGRQWHNRDTGYGICAACITRFRSRNTMPEEEIADSYGREGYHFNV